MQVPHRFQRSTAAILAALVVTAAAGGGASAEMRQQKYANVRGWRIHTVLDDGAFRYCAATTGERQERLRIGFDGARWMVGGVARAKRIEGFVGVDRADDPAIFENAGGNWVLATMHPAFVEALRQGTTLDLTLGKRAMTFSLDGSAAAMLKLQECADRAGAAAPAKPQAQAPAPQGRACPGGEKRLPITGLCPAKAREGFLSNDTAGDLPMPGCKWAVNETEIAGGEVLLYLASSCKGKTARLIYKGGAKTFGLKSSDGDVTITGIAVDAQDPEKSITRYARQAMDNPNAAKRCSLQADDSGMRYTFDVAPDVLARMAADGPPDAVCGRFGRNDTASYWTRFGGYGWHVGLGQDAYVSVATRTMTLLTHVADGNSDSMDGWRVKY